MAKKRNEEYADSGEDGEYQEEPNFDDAPGFIDDISDEGRFLDGLPRHI